MLFARSLRARSAAAAVGLALLTGGIASTAAPASAAPGDAATPASSLPATTACDDPYAVTIRMTNSGATTWTPATHRLVVTGSGAPAAPIAVAADVAPGATASFAVTLDAPAASATTAYTWQMASDSPFGTQGTGTVAVRCALDEAFRGVADFVEDDTFTVDRPDLFFNGNGGAAHGETSTIDLGPAASPRYRLFYRSFVNPDGTKRNDGVPSGVAMATSADGDRWTVTNGGKPVLPAERTTPQFGWTSCSTADCLRTFYAPSVVVEPDGSLLMAFEVWDTGRDSSQAAPVWAIGFARSTTLGTSWTRVVDGSGAPVLFVGTQSWEGYNGGVYNGNVGTPELRRVDGGYELTYHGWNGPLVRGLATGPSVDRLTRLATPTMGQGPGWQGVGVGKASDLREGGYLYRVYEAFRGGSGCMNGTTTVGWGLARSADGGRSWTTSDQNPIRIGRKNASCGDDLPSFQVIAGRDPMVVTTDIQSALTSRATLKRYRLAAVKAAPSNSAGDVVAVAAAPGNGGYWELDNRGEVFAFGSARRFGSAVGTGRTDWTAMAARPDGNGYWLVSARGQVANFGSAAALGQLTNTAVADIQSTPSGNGYWLVTTAGKVSAFGDARDFGDLKKASASPIVALAPMPAGDGYWIVAADGTVTPYGTARRVGLTSSSSGTPSDVVAMVVRPDGAGYWLVGAGGGVWAHGVGTADYGHGYLPVAHFRFVGASARTVGSGTGKLTNGQVDQATGLLVVATDGAVVTLGRARDFGSARTAVWAS